MALHSETLPEFTHIVNLKRDYHANKRTLMIGKFCR